MIEETEIASKSEVDEPMGRYDRKHIRIRGSLAYKYPPKDSRCRLECGLIDYAKIIDKPAVGHPCFLAIGHSGPCEFSSECATYPSHGQAS